MDKSLHKILSVFVHENGNILHTQNVHSWKKSIHEGHKIDFMAQMFELLAFCVYCIIFFTGKNW